MEPERCKGQDEIEDGDDERAENQRLQVSDACEVLLGGKDLCETSEGLRENGVEKQTDRAGDDDGLHQWEGDGTGLVGAR